MTYTLLVNSTDSFEDCWQPFFRLLSEHWPQPRPRIVLNAETKNFSHPGLEMSTSQVATHSRRRNLTWSESLALCLDQIPTHLVLYMQDDYFISGTVRTDVINRCAELMLAESLDCIRLMECEGSGPWHPWKLDWLWEVDRRAKYRMSTQAALWRVDVLKVNLRRHESPWQFEVWGSRRAWRKRQEILCLNRDLFQSASTQVLPYTPTGIVKGKWNRDAVCELFAEHGIEVDYEVRGFYEGRNEMSRQFLPLRAMARVRSLL